MTDSEQITPFAVMFDCFSDPGDVCAEFRVVRFFIVP